MVRRRPGGFTLVELLVVVAILAMLMALAMPAFQAVRESSRRAQCMMNLSRLALGVANHDLAQGAMPGWAKTIVVNGTAANYTFAPQLLPYIERADAYAAFIAGQSSRADLPVFQCPTQGAAGDYSSGALDYLANYGYGASYDITGANPSDDDGGFVLSTSGRSRSLADIEAADGLRCTFLIAESQRSGVYGGAVYAACNPYPTYHSYDGCMAFGFHYSYPSTPINVAASAVAGRYIFPWSRHGGGAAIAFADGSVRFEKESMPLYIYAHLVTSRSVWDSTAQKYTNNLDRTNINLKAAPAPQTQPYTVQESDYK